MHHQRTTSTSMHPTLVCKKDSAKNHTNQTMCSDHGEQAHVQAQSAAPTISSGQLREDSVDEQSLARDTLGAQDLTHGCVLMPTSLTVGFRLPNVFRTPNQTKCIPNQTIYLRVQRTLSFWSGCFYQSHDATCKNKPFHSTSCPATVLLESLPRMFSKRLHPGGSITLYHFHFTWEEEGGGLFAFGQFWAAS